MRRDGGGERRWIGAGELVEDLVVLENDKVGDGGDVVGLGNVG